LTDGCPRSLARWPRTRPAPGRSPRSMVRHSSAPGVGPDCRDGVGQARDAPRPWRERDGRFWRHQAAGDLARNPCPAEPSTSARSSPDRHGCRAAEPTSMVTNRAVTAPLPSERASIGISVTSRVSTHASDQTNGARCSMNRAGRRRVPTRPDGGHIGAWTSGVTRDLPPPPVDAPAHRLGTRPLRGRHRRHSRNRGPRTSCGASTPRHEIARRL